MSSNDFREDLAWVAGFFDGEGHASEQKDGKSHRSYLHIGQKTKPLLDRVRDIVGFGKVYGPYTSKGGFICYEYKVTSFEHIQAFAALVWPWLGRVKKDQFRSILAGGYRRNPMKMKRGPNCVHCMKPVQARGLCTRHYRQMRERRGVFTVFERLS